MGRAQIYYPANQLSEVQIAKPGEFIDEETLEPYVGQYVEANGQYIAGSNPKLGDPILKRIDDLAGEKFRQPISTEYYKLTRKEFDNHYIPISSNIKPTEEDYDDGFIMRYFAQKKNEIHKIYEIDEEQYLAFNRDNEVGIDSKIYNRIEIRWFLTGKDAVQNNKINTQLLDSRYPGMIDFLTNPIEFVRQPVDFNRTYNDETIISDNLPESYGIPPSENVGCKNCKFRHNNYCSKWVAQIRNTYWCQSYHLKPKPLPTSLKENLYTYGAEYLLNGEEYIGYYHIHPDKGAMVGPYHVDQPHDYLTPIYSSESSY
tara:strand:+ start:3971 stop:4915 length:945 start_codon:yes stop_codon:yes gene_type:complete